LFQDSSLALEIVANAVDTFKNDILALVAYLVGTDANSTLLTGQRTGLIENWNLIAIDTSALRANNVLITAQEPTTFLTDVTLVYASTLSRHKRIADSLLALGTHIAAEVVLAALLTHTATSYRWTNARKSY
jgi:hypothetical protein